MARSNHRPSSGTHARAIKGTCCRSYEVGRFHGVGFASDKRPWTDHVRRRALPVGTVGTSILRRLWKRTDPPPPGQSHPHEALGKPCSLSYVLAVAMDYGCPWPPPAP